MEVRLTEIAAISLREIHGFLKHKWSQKEIDIMRNDIEKFVNSFDVNIVRYPYYKDSKIQTALIGKKQVTIFLDTLILMRSKFCYFMLIKKIRNY